MRERFCLTERKARTARERLVLLQDAATRYMAWVEQERPPSITVREKALKHLLAAFDPLPVKKIAARSRSVIGFSAPPGSMMQSC